MTEAAIALLTQLGAEAIEHPGGTLLAHLLRVRDLLARWDYDAEVRLAGLCHAAYGTDGFDVALLPLSDRDRLAAVIGTGAEAIVYFYAGCDRRFSHSKLADIEPLYRDRFNGVERMPSSRERKAFAAITAANELDLVMVNQEIKDRFGPALRRMLESWRPLLPEAAWRDCDDHLPA